MQRTAHRGARATKAMVLALLLVVAVTACGSSSKSSSTSSSTSSTVASSTAATSSASAATGTAKGAPIRVGALCSCFGAEKSQAGKAPEVYQAWASSVNATGGINGHPVKITVLDDSLNPATALTNAKQLIQQDHVIAIVGDISLVDAVWAPYAQAQGVPVVGGGPTQAPFMTNPDFFASGTPLPVQVAGIMLTAKADGKKNLGLMWCAEIPACAENPVLVAGLSPSTGVGAKSVKIAATAPSYTAPCLELRSAGSDVLWVADNAPVVQRVTAACAQQGYKPVNTGLGDTMTSGLLQDPQFDGAKIIASNAPPIASDPAVSAYFAALNKYAPGLTTSSNFSFALLEAWAGATLFETAAKAGKIGPTSTPADVKKALYALPKNETLGGLTPPLNFTVGKPAFPTCWFTIGVQGGKMTAPDGDTPTCLSQTQLATLMKVIHK